MPLQRLAEQPLAVSVAVGPGGVEEVAAQLDGAVERRRTTPRRRCPSTRPCPTCRSRLRRPATPHARTVETASGDGIKFNWRTGEWLNRRTANPRNRERFPALESRSGSREASSATPRDVLFAASAPARAVRLGPERMAVTIRPPRSGLRRSPPFLAAALRRRQLHRAGRWKVSRCSVCGAGVSGTVYMSSTLAGTSPGVSRSLDDAAYEPATNCRARARPLTCGRGVFRPRAATKTKTHELGWPVGSCRRVRRDQCVRMDGTACHCRHSSWQIDQITWS